MNRFENVKSAKSTIVATSLSKSLCNWFATNELRLYFFGDKESSDQMPSDRAGSMDLPSSG